MQQKRRTPPAHTRTRTQSRTPAIRAASVGDKQQTEGTSITVGLNLSAQLGSGWDQLDQSSVPGSAADLGSAFLHSVSVVDVQFLTASSSLSHLVWRQNKTAYVKQTVAFSAQSGANTELRKVNRSASRSNKLSVQHLCPFLGHGELDSTSNCHCGMAQDTLDRSLVRQSNNLFTTTPTCLWSTSRKPTGRTCKVRRTCALLAVR